ncbi:hypothetical protein K439DRAFT_1276308, partial [Ramaria rubella]
AWDSNDCPTLVDATVFQIWKIRITAELCDKKVWGLVDSSEINTGPNVTIYSSYYQGTDSWEVCDGKAHSIIVKCTHIQTWYVPTDVKGAMGINGLSNISEHISNICEAKRKLSSMKQTVDEQFMAFALLHSLPNTPKFETLIMTILNSIQSNNTISFSKVESHLMAQ